MAQQDCATQVIWVWGPDFPDIDHLVFFFLLWGRAILLTVSAKRFCGRDI